MFNWLFAFAACAGYYAAWMTRPEAVQASVRAILLHVHPLTYTLPVAAVQHMGGLGASFVGAAAGSAADTMWSLLLPACVAWVVCGMSREAWAQPDVRAKLTSLWGGNQESPFPPSFAVSAAALFGNASGDVGGVQDEHEQ